MRAVVALLLLSMGCGVGTGGLQACLEDDAACTLSEQCCGSADIRALDPATKYFNTNGVCLSRLAGTTTVKQCCTSYDTPGENDTTWRCFVCAGALVECFKAAPAPGVAL